MLSENLLIVKERALLECRSHRVCVIGREGVIQKSVSGHGPQQDLVNIEVDQKKPSARSSCASP